MRLIMSESDCQEAVEGDDRSNTKAGIKANKPGYSYLKVSGGTVLPVKDVAVQVEEPLDEEEVLCGAMDQPVSCAPPVMSSDLTAVQTFGMVAPFPPHIHTLAGHVVNPSTTCTAHPVALLQEKCIAMALPMPVYIPELISGSDHSPLFHISCQVGTISFPGSGRTKKDAKKHSAAVMLHYLFSLSEAEARVAVYGAEFNQSLERGMHLQLDKEGRTSPSDSLPDTNLCSSIKTFNQESAHMLHQFYDSLQPEPETLLRQLILSEPNTFVEEDSNYAEDETTTEYEEGYDDDLSNSYSALCCLADEQGFQLDLQFLPDPSEPEDVFCILSIANPCVIEACGTGPDQETAREEAAKIALTYILSLVKAPDLELLQ